MSEMIHHTPENPGESLEKAGEQQETPKSAERREHHDPRKALEHARAEAAKHALPAEKSRPAQPKQNHHAQVYVDKKIMKMTYRRTMKRIRKQLSPAGRAGSAIIHQPVVEAVSDAAGKTVARPSGLLGGGLVAFTGTAAYYFLAKHYQYAYNNTVFLILLLGGFALGWILEALWRLSHRTN